MRRRFGIGNWGLRIESSRPCDDRQSAIRNPQSNGFTLVEVLLATGLALLVLTGVYASIQQYWRMRNAGEEQRHRVQVAKAIYTKLSSELRSIVFVPDEDQEEIVDPEAALEEDLDETEIEAVDPAEEFARMGFGLIGTADTLLFYVSKPMTTSEYSVDPTTGDLVSGGPDLRSIVYTMANGPVATADATGPLRSAIDQEFEGITGLIRMEGDQASLQLADSLGDTGILVSHAKMLADEVVGIEFQYLDPDAIDGQAWQSSWNTMELNRLPSAIKVTLILRTRDDRRPPQDIINGKKVWRQELVINMPLYHPDTTPDELETEEP